MTFDDLMGLASIAVSPHAVGTILRTDREVCEMMSKALLNLFGEAQPCGWPEPLIADDGEGAAVDIGIGDPISTGELRALCAIWMRACDEAEAKEHAGD
jgi:hypothetical protein